MSAEIRVEHDGRDLGVLRRVERGITFEPTREWLAKGPELSPIIPLCRPGVHRCNLPDLMGLHGLFYNSLPDMWGTRLMEQEFAARGLPYPDALDRLAYVGRHGMGSLVFKPALGTFDRAAAGALDLLEAARHARHIEAHGGAVGDMREFFGGNATAGGARPKINVRRLASGGYATEVSADLLGETGEPFLLKFETDAKIERVEHALLRLARAAGLRVVDTEQVVDGDHRHLLVRRFDRDGAKRHHCPTLYALTEGHYRSVDHADYLDLADAAKVLRCPGAPLEILMRALFGRVVGNLDDHHKNHAFRLLGDRWELTPAYDITHTSGTRHAMRLCGRADAGEGSAAAEFAATQELPWDQVLEGMRHIRAALTRWPEFAAEAGVPPGVAILLGDLMLRRAAFALNETAPTPAKPTKPRRRVRSPGS